MSMVNFVVYNSTTGVITRTGCCQSSVLSSQANTGETAMEGTADIRKDYVDLTTTPTITRKDSGDWFTIPEPSATTTASQTINNIIGVLDYLNTNGVDIGDDGRDLLNQL